jgi:flagellar hook-associated protein 2
VAQISSLGVGSGLDLAGLVTNLVAAERAPDDNRLNRIQQRAQAELSAFGSLSGAASRLNDVLKELSGETGAMKATSSVPEQISASAGTGAEAGRYTLSVSQLATAQSLATDAFADPDAALGAGVLHVSVGSASVDITVGADVLSLRDVRDAINASALDVRAILVNDSGGARLLLTSGQTGAASAMTLTVDGSVDGRLASAAMTETVAATDAAYRINGLDLTSATNELNELIPGVSLTLERPTVDPAGVTIVVEPDSEQLAGKLSSLVDAYNGLIDVIGSTGRVDVAGGNSGPLVGNAALRALQSRVSGVFSATVKTDPPAQFSSLLQLGLHTDASGKVSLDSTRLDAALASNHGDATRLVAQFATNLSQTLDRLAGSTGLIASRSAGLSAELHDVANQRAALNTRMSSVEERLRKQFAALDTLVSQMQSTSGFLTDQLASLATLRPGNQKN